MARTIKSQNLEARTERLKLPIDSRPTFVKISRGVALGYRRNRTNGTWVARAADGRGGKHVSNVGLADDYQEADGASVLSYRQALDAARRFAAGKTDHAVVTVADALDEYAKDIEIRGKDARNVSRVRHHLDAKLADKPLALVTSREWQRWRDAVSAKVSPSTVNRVLHNLRAALNAAATHDRNIDPHAWRVGLTAFRNADRTRNVILDEATVRAIVDAANCESDEFGLFVEVAAQTGARPSQLRRLLVQDLIEGKEGARLAVPVSYKGNSKATKSVAHRSAPISAGLAAKLKVAAAGRARTVPLLTHPSGGAWKVDDHKFRFSRSVARAGQDPAVVTIYAIRHSSIVRMILAGVPIRVVADHHDTSVIMIERNYSALIGAHTDAMVRGALLDTETGKAEGKVVPLRP
jgi:integrase